MTYTTTYSPYGVVNTIASLLGFKGALMDSFSQYYPLGNGHRRYNPQLMRFNEPDSLSPFKEGGINSYTFVLGDPINNSDPSGRMPLPNEKQIIRDFTKKIYVGAVVAEFDGVTVFKGLARKPHRPPTLYISAHGSRGYLEGREGYYSGQELFKKLKDRGIPLQHQQMHIFSCHSATRNKATGSSLIEDLSGLTNAQVSGYAGNVSIDISRESYKITLRVLHTHPDFQNVSTKTRAGDIRKSHTSRDPDT